MLGWLTLLSLVTIAVSVPPILGAMPRWRMAALIAIAVATAVILGSCCYDGEALQVVRFALMPLGFLWLAMVGVLTHALLRRQRELAVGAAVLAIIVWVGGNQWIGAGIMTYLERRLDAGAIRLTETYDCVCVLGGGSNRRFDGQPQLSMAGDRLRVAALLYQQGKTPLLLTTGVFAADTVELLKAHGVPPAAILSESSAEDTADEIIIIKRLASEHRWTRIGVVSSAWHLPRALRLGARQDLPLLALPADWHGVALPASAVMAVPKAQGLLDLECGMKELVGLWLQ
jgi:uncharacterized SAM-binding protein YcdF (DUF218 family)